jgi:hypothetical protein
VLERFHQQPVDALCARVRAEKAELLVEVASCPGNRGEMPPKPENGIHIHIEKSAASNINASPKQVGF